MSAREFDPIDLAMLAAGWQAAMSSGSPQYGLRIDDAGALIVAAEILHTLWLDVADCWGSVWAYDVAEPLGAAIAAEGIADDPEAIRRRAVEIIEAAIRADLSATDHGEPRA